MQVEIEATYENGVLKPDRELPLQNGERVKLTVQKRVSAADRLYGMIQWKGSPEDLDYLLGPDNHPWAREE
jgi:predicted DNA-binding antitoxin AbrB/MazE fold protein